MLMWMTRLIVVNLELLVSVSMFADAAVSMSEVKPILVVLVVGRLAGATLISQRNMLTDSVACLYIGYDGSKF